ncbi:MAG: hypothetical protein SO135_06565 [Sphaerochaetaceae bacterium]|nr:hypothetical protein [Sphaerochaetaceae bacterium]
MKNATLSTMIFVTLILFSIAVTGCATTGHKVSEIENAALELGQAYIDRNDFESALSTYEKALSVAPTRKILYNRMLCLFYMQRYEDADLAAIEAQKLFPESLFFSAARVEFFISQQKNDNAIEVCQQILQLNPYSEEIAVKLLGLLESSDRIDEAKELARTMLIRQIGVSKASELLLKKQI